MAEEDNEVLDWGQEDDVVSLGDEDERYAPEEPSASQNGTADASSAPGVSAAPSRSISAPPVQDDPDRTPDQTSAAPTPEPSTAGPKLPIPTRLTHALPQKPVTTNVPYLPPSDPTIVEATAMASRSKKADNPGPELKEGCRFDHQGPLPPYWEIRFSRDRPKEFYYFNLQNDQATWERPQTTTPVSTEPSAPLSHDDRHYRPEGRHTSGSGRRYENSGDTSETRHPRHPQGNPARSPPRGRDRSRTPSPQGRDSRARGGQRPARGRGNKVNGPQREVSTSETPKTEDRHWVPSPPSASTHLSRSARRQLSRAQNQSTDTRAVVDSRPEEPVKAAGRSHNRDRERPYTPDYPPSNNNTRPITPPQEDEHVVIYQTKVPPRSDRPLPERQRSPGPTPEAMTPNPNPSPSPQPQARRERPSRFGPPPATERTNGLPVKPITLPVDRPTESSRVGDRQHERRMEPIRQFGDSAPHYSPPVNRSPVQSRHPEPILFPPANGDREQTSPILSENPGSTSSRKRQPLPPQDAEFRVAGRTKSGQSETASQRGRDITRSPSFNFQARAQPEKVIEHPLPPHGLHRSYSGRDGTRESGYSQPPSASRDVAPEYDRDYDRGYERERPRARQHMNDHKDQDREFDMGVESLSLNEGRGYQERERDPPSKPRAMHQDAVVTSPAYAPVGPSNLKYRDRPSPPHLSVSDSRRDLDNRSGPPPPAWQERRDDRREDKPYVPTPDRPPVREPRGRPAPASSANSIPIGTRRAFVPEPPVNDYPPSATNDRYERPSYPANDVPRQTRNHEQDHPRPYVQEPVPETRQGYPKVPRNDPQVAIDNRSRRMDKPESLPRNPTTLPGQPENISRQQRQSHFSGPRNPRFDDAPRGPPPQRKVWQGDYDTSPRRGFSNDSPLDATAPPLSREPSYTSPKWEQPPTGFHKPPPRPIDYHEAPGYRDLPPHTMRMAVDQAPRQAPMISTPYDAPPQPAPERYRRNEAEIAALPRPPQPPPRANNRRDPSSYSPETRRAPGPNALPLDGMERHGGGGRQKRNQAGPPVEDNAYDGRPRLLNERISGLPQPPPPEMRVGHKPPQGIRQDNGYNGEPDTFEARASGRMDIRQNNNLPPPPTKTFEQRLDPIDRPPMPRAGSLLSRISHGGNDVPPPPSLRERVQVGNKRDREEMVRGHFPDVDADDGDLDSGKKRHNKRRRARRGGGPA